MLDVEVVSRQGTLSDDDWWDLHLSVHRGLVISPVGNQLPDKLLRLGVRYADGTKATTIEQDRRQTPAPADPPAGPLLSWSPGPAMDQLTIRRVHRRGASMYLWAAGSDHWYIDPLAVRTA